MSDPAGEGQVLALVDDSPAAKTAARVAADVAAGLGRPLAILGVCESSDRDAAIAAAIAEAQAEARSRVPALETIQATGELIRVAQRRVSETSTALVVLGASFHGSASRRVVAARVWGIVKALSPPVLVVTARVEKIRRALFCTGGERFIEEGAAFAARLAASLAAEVEVFHVVPHAPTMYGGRVEREEESAEEFLATNSRVSRNVRRQIELFRSAGVPVTFRVAGGEVVGHVLAEIRRSNPDLVIVGSVPGRGAFETYMLGDMTREIIARAGKPFLVLRSKRPGLWSEIWRSFTEGAAGRPEKSAPRAAE